MAPRKPLDPSPTPWNFKTWGNYCDACQVFFDLLMDGRVETFEAGGECYARHFHWCGCPSRYISYLRDGEPCSHPGCLSHVSHPCEGCGRTAGISRK